VFFPGQLDEAAIWNRALSENEVAQLYSRGANRVILQVKSCIDITCNCKSYGASGTANNCDGDSELNDIDINDDHKAHFIGPGGDSTTFYSEIYNRNAVFTTLM